MQGAITSTSLSPSRSSRGTDIGTGARDGEPRGVSSAGDVALYSESPGKMLSSNSACYEASSRKVIQ